MRQPRQLVERIEATARLPDGGDERFVGYGVMAAPFATGHLLAMRRFPASSIGPGYASVWHWSPDGSWTFYTDVDPSQSCNRYWGNDITTTKVTPITIDWTGPGSFTIRTGDGALDWVVNLGSTLATRIMSVAGQIVPDRLWREPIVLAAMEPVASRFLRAGRIGLRGTASNGQFFKANPQRLWSIPSSRATIRGTVLDRISPLPEQIRLGDFWLPQRGLFAIGRAFMEPFDSERHLSIVSMPNQSAQLTNA